MRTPLEIAIEALRRIAAAEPGDRPPEELARGALDHIEDFEEVIMSE